MTLKLENGRVKRYSILECSEHNSELIILDEELFYRITEVLRSFNAIACTKNELEANGKDTNLKGGETCCSDTTASQVNHNRRN